MPALSRREAPAAAADVTQNLTCGRSYVLVLFVKFQSEKRARAEAVLGELAELGLMLARELAVRARESEDADEAVALAAAFQKTSRAVRLTLALDCKLDRDAARAAREAAAEIAKAAEPPPAVQAPVPAPVSSTDPAAQRIAARKGRVDALLNRLLWNEAEGDEEDYEVLCDDLTARLDEAAHDPDFEVLPIEVLAARIVADMGLKGEVTLSLREAPPPSADTG
jgi:hypothetical protein